MSSDGARPLSTQGRGEIQDSARELLKRSGPPALILHSPLTRAAQSAQEAARILGCPSSQVESFSPLANLMPPVELFPRLSERAQGAGHILIVGHQPQLGELAAWLSRGSFDFPTAGILALRVSGPAQAQVLWSRP